MRKVGFFKGSGMVATVVMLMVTMAVAASAATEHTTSVAVDGVQYGFVVKDDGTAELNKIVEADVEGTAVSIPAAVTDEKGEEYKVTGLNLSGADKAVGNLTDVTNITLPATLATVKGDFKEFPNLSELVVPENVTTFKASLAGLEKLTDVTLPEGATMTKGMFRGDTSLKKITLPASVTEIPAAAFQGCTNLETVTVKGTVTSIGAKAFTGAYDEEEGTYGEMKHLTTIEGLNWSKVKEVGEYAFYNCRKLEVTADLSGLTEISDYAFADCLKLTVTKLSDNLKTIGDWGLLGCRLEAPNHTFTLPEGLTSVGNYAFYYVKFLDSTNTEQVTVVIPNSVTEIGDKAFYGAYWVKAFEVGKGLEQVEDEVFDTYGNTMKSIRFDNAKKDVKDAHGNLEAMKEKGTKITYAQGALGGVTANK